MEKDLMQRIILALRKEEELSIPELREVLDIEDEFFIQEAIGKLEEDGLVEFSGF